ncbi:MAG: hypothetical protein K2K85_06095 [Clostridia bacterium]|nr:hypothetical protein [Clostridia bacterium]
MTNKAIKVVNWLNVALSVAALILECMPKSVKYCLCSVDGNIIKYSSFFGNPLSGFFISDVIVAITILNLIFSVFFIIKNKLSIKIINIVLTLLGLAACVRLLVGGGVYVTVYEIIVSILFYIMSFINFNIFETRNKKIIILNLITMLVIILTFILQLIPWSLRIVQKLNYSALVTFEDVEHSYFIYQKNWISLMGFIIAILTFCILLFNFITFSKDKKGLCVTQLVMSSVCVLCSIIILIMVGSSLTAYNIIIMLLFIVPIITQSIKLKTVYNSMDKS